MRMMNIRYILSPQAINHPELKLVFTENMQTGVGRIPIWVYELNAHFERAWFVEKVESAKNDEIWSKIMNDSFDPKLIAYTDSEIDNQSFALGNIVSTDYNPNQIKLNVNSEGEGFLVVSEVHYPLRWQAYMDGEKVNTYETNGVLRGIIVPEGEHLIEFKYDKSVFRNGLKVSVAAVLLSLTLIVVGLLRIRK